MMEEQKMTQVNVAELVDKVGRMKSDGYRLVQIGCTMLADTVEINYSFDKNYEFINMKLTVPREGASVPSVSGVYWSAFLYENEIHDLFGVEIKDIALDYKGKFYRTAVKKPFAQSPEKKEGV